MNMRKNIIEFIFNLNFILWFLFTFIPIFTLVFNIYFIFLSMLITSLLVFYHCLYSHILAKTIKILVPLIAFFVLEFFYMLLSSDKSLYLILFDIFYTFYVVLFVVIFFFLNFNFYNFTSKFIIASVFFTLVTSIIGLLNDPEAARFLATNDANLDSPYFISILLQNIGGYLFVYTVIFIPLFISLVGKISIINLFLIFLILIYVYLSNYAIAFIFFIISIVPFTIPKKFSAKGLLLLIILSIIFFLAYRIEIGTLLFDISVYLRSYSETFYERFRAISDLLTGTFNPINSITRFDLYFEAYLNIINNLPFGSIIGEIKVINHSFILDFLSIFGIFGSIVIILIYNYIINFYKLYFNFNSKSLFILVTFSILLSTLNPLKPFYPLLYLIPTFFIGYKKRFKKFDLEKQIFSPTVLCNV